jgi:hypothetical protein
LISCVVQGSGGKIFKILITGSGVKQQNLFNGINFPGTGFSTLGSHRTTCIASLAFAKLSHVATSGKIS